MIDYKYKDLFYKSNVSKQLNIKLIDGKLDNSNIYLNTFSLEESICNSKELMFGGCIASTLKFQIKNDGIARERKVLKVTEIINGDTENPLNIGTYKVHSDKCSSDRSYREIIAYDYMYTICNTDISSWFSGLIFPMTLKKLRDSLFEFIDVEQEVISLPNDNAIIYSGVSTGSSISASDVLEDICAINGCFGKINREGIFIYLFLSTSNPYELPSGNTIDLSYEDYNTDKIDKLRIVQSSLDYTYVYGEGTNCYEINANVLSYGRTPEELEVIAQTVYNVISEITYVPIEMNIKGNPCFETGDYIKLHSKDGKEILTYILNRTLTGVQSHRDNYIADGVKIYYQNLNSTEKTISTINGRITEVSNNITYEHTFINSEDISVNSMETTIIQINATDSTDSSVIFICTIPFTISLDGYIEFNYYLNGSIITTDTVNFYSTRGDNVVTLSNVLDVTSNERVTLKVTAKTKYFESDYRIHDAKIISFENYINTGTYEEAEINTDIPEVSIKAKSIKAVMFARGLASGTEWDGNIELDEYIEPINIINTSISDFSTNIVTSTDYPKSEEITDNLSVISLIDTSIISLNESIIFNEVVKNYVLNTDKADNYSYDRQYISTEDGKYSLRSDVGAITKQSISTNDIDLSNLTITGIESVSVISTGTPLFALSFDSGTTWKMHNGTSWLDLSDDESGMLPETLESITIEQWSEEINGITSMKLRFTLSEIEDTVTSVTIDFTN